MLLSICKVFGRPVFRPIKSYWFVLLLFLLPVVTVGQLMLYRTSMDMEKQVALQLLDKADHTIQSSYWPNIPPDSFYQNVKRNIIKPERVYQGHSTNFCAYAAITVLLCRERPMLYARYVTELYQKGETMVNGKLMKPSAPVREAAGILYGKGKLALNPADQLWLLSMPDFFKGVLNFDKKYDPGDENRVWSICPLGKFNNMLREAGAYETQSYGSDLFRPTRKSNLRFIQDQLANGKTVILYVNSKFLHPSRFRIYALRAPTHYIIVYGIAEDRGVLELKYWDYGLKTVELMSPKHLRKMVYGIVCVNKPGNE